MAAERREERIRATAAATAHYADPREGMSSQELRAELESLTSKSKPTQREPHVTF